MKNSQPLPRLALVLILLASAAFASTPQGTFERTLSVSGAVEYPRRFRPVTNIGTPALIERALDTPGQDRVFLETLLAAGNILSRERGTE